MKNTIGALCLLLAGLGLLSSCLNSDESDVTLYEDTAITAVTLGTLNRYTYTYSSVTGNDTIIKTTLVGSAYKMTIDHIGRKIYNQTELPLGTDLEHVVISTLSTKNGGLALIKSPTSDTLSYIGTTDSLDFSIPRTLRVYSSSGKAYRDYTMTLTASETTGVNFHWVKAGEFDQLKGWKDQHLVVCLDTALMVDRGTIVFGDDINSVTAMRLGDDGRVEHASFEMDGHDGLDGHQNIPPTEEWIWKTLPGAEAPGLATLIGVTDHEIFALGTDGRLKVCTDGIGREWRDEQLDSDASLLPTKELTLVSWPYAPADSMDYVLLAGQSENGEHTVLWRKISRYSEQTDKTEGKWVYMPLDGANRYPLPSQEGLSMAYYNGSVLAVGNQLQVLQSRDQGITWKKNGAYSLPASLQGTRVSMASAPEGRMWLVTDTGQLWLGQLW